MIIDNLVDAKEILQGMLYAIDKDVEFPLQSDLDELLNAKSHIDLARLLLINNARKQHQESPIAQTPCKAKFAAKLRT